MRTTTAVLGAGPAGLAIAAALADRSVPVVVVDPRARSPWPANYGIWLDEAEAVGLSECLEQRWDAPEFLSDHGRHVLDRVYAKVDKAALQRSLLDRLDGNRVLAHRCVGVTRTARHTEISLANGQTLTADVVVDATGATSPFTDRPPANTRYQTAWGIVAEVEGHPWQPGEMVLMDFRGATRDGPATFLYALPYDRTTVFLEETSLAAAPPVSLGELRRRLSARLERMGIRVRRVHDTELCSIAMDLPIPPPTPGLLPFGAAASFVHPASGYSLPRTIAAAPVVAEAIHRELGGGPESALDAAWRAQWSPAQRRSDQLARFGLAMLADLPGDDLARFLHGFFQLPVSQWSRVLSASATARERLEAMVHTGLHLPPRLQLRALAHGGSRLLTGAPAATADVEPA